MEDSKIMKKENVINSIKASIKKKYGSVPSEWEMQLDQLVSHLDIYNKAKANLDEQPITITNRFGEQVPNPNIKILNDASIQLTKLAQQFGLNAWSLKKLAVEEDENEDFVKNLLND